MKRFCSLVILTLFSGILTAQTADEALRYSMQTYNGTARSAAMGGAFGALGGDFSSLSINPAGIGVYRTSEFTFTPSLRMTEATNSGVSQNKYSFSIGNIGYVATFKPRLEDATGWKNFNIGFGYNRVNNFRRDAFMQIAGSATSLLDVFASNTNGIPVDGLDQFSESLAFGAFLLDTVAGNPTQYLTPLVEGDLVNQRLNLIEKGYIGEYVFSFGANYDHKLYLGGSFGIQYIYYKSTSIYSENLVEGSLSELNNFTFRESLKTTGVGFNFKFGAIYKLDNLRLGAAIHTPTFYDMNDEFKNTITAQFNTNIPDSLGATDYEAVSPFGEFDYDLETPLRAVLSAAYVFGNKGLVSFDYEYVDYSEAKFSDAGDGSGFFGTEQNPGPNEIINSSFQSVGNIRVGAEYRVNSYFSLRGGYTHFGSPYKSGELNSNASYDTFSAGWGLKRDNFFFDMAYLYSTQDEKFVLFAPSPTNLETQKHQLRMTFGFKF